MSMLDEIVFFIFTNSNLLKTKDENLPTNLVFHVSKIFLKYFPVYNSIQDKSLISKEWKRIYQAAL